MVTTSGNGLTRMFILVLFIGGLLVWLLLGKPIPNMESQKQLNFSMTPAPSIGGIGGGSESLYKSIEPPRVVDQQQELNSGVEVQKLHDEIAHLDSEMQSFHNQLAQMTGSMATQNQLKALENKNVELGNRVVNISEQISEFETSDIPSLREDLMRLSQQVQNLENEINRIQKFNLYSILAIVVLVLLSATLVVYTFHLQKKLLTAIKMLTGRYEHFAKRLNNLQKKQGENEAYIEALHNSDAKKSEEIEDLIKALKIMDKRLRRMMGSVFTFGN